jgi:hypothetical protein
MHAIVTTYHGPTDHNGARIVATWNGHRVSISYPYELNAVEAHEKAANLMRVKHKIIGRMVSADLNKKSMVHIVER